MRIALLADVHSNIVALEAVLRGIKKHAPDITISLGDQINLGPCPKETLQLLRAEGVTCLHGNHERYVISKMEDHPGYRGANFDQLRFSADMFKKEEITFEKQLELEGVTFCHAMPGDDRFPVYDVDKAIPLLRQMRFEKPMHIICGHGHNPTNIHLPNLTIQSIGSVGCMDDAPAGIAPYAILTTDGAAKGLRPYYAAYDTALIKPLFEKSGILDYCPIMARIACIQMTTNTDLIVPFVARANAMSKAKGEEQISLGTWQEADRTYAWPDDKTTAQFWKSK